MNNNTNISESIKNLDEKTQNRKKEILSFKL